MMDGTDRHCRYFHRLMSRHARLYTEMIVADAVIHGDRDRLLGFDPIEHPVALQIGGSDPTKLAEAARIGAAVGYDEINLNVGCPSDRVQSGTFGACLMKTPDLVADCMAAIGEAVDIPATVKCRIGVDDQDPEESLFTLVDKCAAVGVRVFIVHARKAWLQGLSPKENREIPPLDYALVQKLKVSRPDLTIIVNGGIETIDQCKEHLDTFDGVMLGRTAYGEPRLLMSVDPLLFGDEAPAADLNAVIDAMDDYLQRAVARGIRANHVVRHMSGLLHGLPHARTWRRLLSEGGAATDNHVIRRAWAAVEAQKTSLTADVQS